MELLERIRRLLYWPHRAGPTGIPQHLNRLLSNDLHFALRHGREPTGCPVEQNEGIHKDVARKSQHVRRGEMR